LCWFRCNYLARATFGLDLGASGSAESMGANGELPGQFTTAENLNTIAASIGQTSRTQGIGIDPGSLFELVEGIQIDGQVAGGMPGIVETPLGNPANQGHLATFKTNADRASGTGGLTFATAPAGLAMAAGFTLAEPFAAVFSAGTGS